MVLALSITLLNTVNTIYLFPRLILDPRLHSGTTLIFHPLRATSSDFITVAVFPDLPGFEVQIVVNGVVCEELLAPNDVNEDEPKSITRYIEATSGARFEVHVFIRREALALQNHDMSAWLRVDDKSIENVLWHQGKVTGKARVIKGPEEQTSTGWTRRDLVFLFSTPVCSTASIFLGPTNVTCG